MKITYTGRQVELAPAQLKKLEAQFAKIGKLLDGKEECEAHVVLSLERHLHHGGSYHQLLQSPAGGPGLQCRSVHRHSLGRRKAGKAGVKARTKWRDTKRVPRKAAPEVEIENAAGRGARNRCGAGRQVFKIKPAQKRKPMTLEEAMLEMDRTRDYLVYRDAETDRVSVLVRRRDGHFDLVEG